jgi:UrcA family protein
MKKTVAGSCDLVINTVFAVLALGGTALATEAEIPQQAVHYNDLDLSQEAAVARLYQRIAAAANTVCADADRADLASKMRHRACVQRAIEGAVTAVNQPALLALYQGKHPRSVARGVASLEDKHVPSASAP